jgi:hypothetical protein
MRGNLDFDFYIEGMYYGEKILGIFMVNIIERK